MVLLSMVQLSPRVAGRVRGRTLVWACALAAAPAGLSAQDPELQAALFARGQGNVELEDHSLQIYRLPIAIELVNPRGAAPGWRLLLPVSIGAHDLTIQTPVGRVTERIETITVALGVEARFPAGRHWLIKPYAEVAVAENSSELHGALYSLGVRARAEIAGATTRRRFGAAARYSSPRDQRTQLRDYTSLEVGADYQRRFARGEKRSWFGGGYAIARVFPGFGAAGGDPAAQDRNVGLVGEAGFSLSTDPPLSLWRLRLPWLAFGYRTGDLTRGYRVSFAFPF